MAFDQTSSPKTMLPPPVNNVIRSDESVNVGSGAAVPVYYPDTGLVGVGYGNVASGGGSSTTWCIRPHPPLNPNVGFNFPNRVAVGNAVDLSGSFVATSNGYPLNLGNWVTTGNALDSNSNSNSNNSIQYGSRVIGNGTGVGLIGTPSDHVNQSASQASENSGDDSVSGRKLKFMCSYGGRIYPRPSDGVLRYVGGQTRIISVKRNVSFNDLVQKMVDTFGQPVVIKYQLPGEDLDALVSVSCADDLDNMMEEYERLIQRSKDGSPKLRVFLFSASELDPSGLQQFANLNDGGQKYVEAVNGIFERIDGNKLTRKGSLTSAASTQNSDLSGFEAPDSTNAAQVDVNGLPMSTTLSPDANVIASHDATTANVMVSDPVESVHSSVSAVSLGIPVANSAPTQPPPFQNEVEVEKLVPVTLSQQQFGLQQSGMQIPPSAPLQAFTDPRQQVLNHPDYVPMPAHMGFPNPQPVGRSGTIYSQQYFHDNTARFTSQQVIPALHVTMTQPSSHAGIRPSVIQPQQVIHGQQNGFEQYYDENTSGLRMHHQLISEQSCKAYPVQVPFGGNYGWVQISPSEHVFYHDGMLPQQPVMVPQRVEDCYMCQKKLPHAHSDPVVQDQHNSCVGSVPDSMPSYNSLPVEDNLRAQPTNRVSVTAQVKEGNVNVEQAVGTRPRDIISCGDTSGLPLEAEGERNRSDHPRNAVIIPEMVARTGEKQSSGDGLTGTAPLSYLDDFARQHMVPVETWAKEDVVLNTPVNEIPLVGGTSVENSVCRVQESSTEYTNELANTISKADAVENWIAQDLLKPIDGGMDNLKIRNPETFVNNDNFDYSTQHAIEKKGVDLDNIGRSKLIADGNQIKMVDTLPNPTVEISYGNKSRPVEYNEVAHSPVWGSPGTNPQSKNGNHQKDDAVLSSISQPVGFGHVQDSSNSLFSNQDPWNIHGTYYPPPRPDKVTSKKETYSYMDQLGENSGNGVEQKFDGQLNDGLYQTFKQNSTLEEARYTKEDQQLQAVAESSAASVLHSSTSNPDLHARDVSLHENIEDGDVQNNLLDVHCKEKAQDDKSNLSEKANFGFPASDVGSLQIIKNSDLEELVELGSGTFGTVYHGKWRGTDVAIKRINDRCFAGKPSEQERLRADFWNEAIKLADLHHPNVVAFYGVVLDGPGGSVATVTEYMVNGSLRNACQKNGRNLDKRKRLMIAMDVAFGMEYLHGKNIVHFDLKSDNLLVNLRDPHRPICKVGDLGLSKVKCQTLISGGVRGTLPWMAPELLNGSSSLVSEKVDVFSFGIVMWELLTGEEPYADLHYGAIIGGIVNNTLRPPVPESCDPEWRVLMERCWSSEPSERPSFTEIANDLRSMAAKISPKGQNQQQQPASSQNQVQK